MLESRQRGLQGKSALFDARTIDRVQVQLLLSAICGVFGKDTLWIFSARQS